MNELYDISCLQCKKKFAVAFDENPNVFCFPQYLFCSKECALEFSKNPDNRARIDEMKRQHFGYIVSKSNVL